MSLPIVIHDTVVESRLRFEDTIREHGITFGAEVLAEPCTEELLATESGELIITEDGLAVINIYKYI